MINDDQWCMWMDKDCLLLDVFVWVARRDRNPPMAGKAHLWRKFTGRAKCGRMPPQFIDICGYIFIKHDYVNYGEIWWDYVRSKILWILRAVWCSARSVRPTASWTHRLGACLIRHSRETQVMEPLEGYGMNPIPIIPPTMVNMRIEGPQNEQILHISPLNHGFWYFLVLYLFGSQSINYIGDWQGHDP